MNNTEEQYPKPKRRLNKKTIAITTSVFLVALAFGGIYNWQHTMVVQTNDQVTSLKRELSVSAAKQSNLQKENAKNAALLKMYQSSTKSSITAPAIQADLGLAILAAKYVNPSGTVTEKGNWYGMRVKLTNTKAQPISLTMKNLSLKDAQDNLYNIFGYSGATTLPEGWGTNTIQDQTISPGSSITGTIIFQMANKNLNSFTLLNDSKAYPVSTTE